MASLSVLRILRTIKERGIVSRTELQTMTDLSWGTITNTTRELLNRNLIREEGALQTKAGRKPVRLAINPDSHSLIGIDLNCELIRCMATNLNGDVLFEKEKSFPISLAPEAVLDLVLGLIQEALHSPKVEGRICLGVGVGAPGSIDAAAGIIRVAPRLTGWANVPVRDYLQHRLPIPVLLEHDPNCLALAERWFGHAGSAEDVLCLMMGAGVGLGIMLNGEIYRGSQQQAGEFGHTTVHPEGPLCACGNRGCVEAYSSSQAVIEGIRSKPQDQSEYLKKIFAERTPTLEEVSFAADNGDVAARNALQNMGTFLGIGLSNLVNILNPELIVLCGPMLAVAQHFLPALDEQVQHRSWKHSSRQIILSELGARGIAIGSCGAVLQSLFDTASLAVQEESPIQV